MSYPRLPASLASYLHVPSCGIVFSKMAIISQSDNLSSIRKKPRGVDRALEYSTALANILRDEWLNRGTGCTCNDSMFLEQPIEDVSDYNQCLDRFENHLTKANEDITSIGLSGGASIHRKNADCYVGAYQRDLFGVTDLTNTDLLAFRRDKSEGNFSRPDIVSRWRLTLDELSSQRVVMYTESKAKNLGLHPRKLRLAAKRDSSIQSISAAIKNECKICSGSDRDRDAEANGHKAILTRFWELREQLGREFEGTPFYDYALA